jgi:hypothetical protein
MVINALHSEAFEIAVVAQLTVVLLVMVPVLQMLVVVSVVEGVEGVELLVADIVMVLTLNDDEGLQGTCEGRARLSHRNRWMQKTE